MVCSGALGFFLLFLLHPALGVKNLQNIINHLHNKYGVNNQYALGINVPVRFCDQHAALDQNFLPNDNDAQKVKDDMAVADRIYKGKQLIGARPKQIPGTQNNYHSEYLLLIHSMSKTLSRFDPLMQTLLNSDPNGCTVFFTLNSPCVKTCSTPNGRYSIIPALSMFQNRKGPKAFVFRQVWEQDVGKPAWEENIRNINNIIPVYRCEANECIPCVDKNQVKQKCVRN
ncbi:uncharacterized protein LOC113544627 [Pangasianodon hypophthalmus]|uniref:uncharacterized protein LOC113544627 n=1 Tax=Pangasianodon hypophthalmus TaxID=310915 RepID=UPI0023079E3E|nr:uncharacterized protein LOC113544627 [Pangasianodon hypophthalmus]